MIDFTATDNYLLAVSKAIRLWCALLLLTASAAGAVLPAGLQTKEEAEAAANEGFRNLQNSRYKEAVDSFNRAVALQPDLFDAQYGLGLAYKSLGQHADAVAPFNRAIRLRPNFALAYRYLGESYFRLEQMGLAIDALKKAISLKIKDPLTYSLLGYAAYKSGRWEDAIEGFNGYIKLTKENTAWERRRIGWLNLFLARGEEAAAQAMSNLKTDGWQEKDAQYNVLIAYLGYRQAKRETEAHKILDEAALKVKQTEWPYPVLKYLRHEIKAEELLDIAGGGLPAPIASDTGKTTEARAYIGMELLLSGRTEEALTHLRWVRDNGQREAPERLLSISELNRIAK